MSAIELKISEKILSGTSVIEESESIPNGARGFVYIYEASCPDSALALSRIEFGSEILWVIQRDSVAPYKIEFRGNGIDTLKIICENGCNDDYYFNAYMKAGWNA